MQLNCGLCELKLGWIVSARERNRQGLCLTWSLAHLSPLHVYGTVPKQASWYGEDGESGRGLDWHWVGLLVEDVDFYSGVRRVLFHEY